MNFLDVIISGRPFKRVVDPSYYTHFEGMLIGEGNHQRGISQGDVQATDWEIEEQSVQVKQSEILTVIDALLKDPKSKPQDFFAELTKLRHK